MRDYNFAFVGSRHRQLGGGGSKVGDITWAFANPDPTLYHDALVTESLSGAAYPDLLAMQGPLFGKVRPFPQNAASAAALNMLQGCAWNGALYTGSFAGIAKRANMAAAFTAVPTLAPGAGSTRPMPVPSSPLGTFLLLTSSNAGSIYLTVATSDTVKSATVLMPGGGNPVANVHTAVEGIGANTLLALIAGAGPIYRTTDKGATWIQVGGPLSTPADRVWLLGWKSGANIYLLGAQGVFATSTDDGGTWTVNTAVPGAVALYQPQLSTASYTTACLDKRPGGTKGYALTAAGGIVSWLLANPGAGFTTEAAAGTLSLGGNSARFSAIKGGVVMATLDGIWGAGWANLIKPTLLVPVAVLQAPPNYVPVQTDLATVFCTFAAEPGNGELVFDIAGTPAVKVSFAMNDGTVQFDRYTITDPPLSSGRKPFVRVL